MIGPVDLEALDAQERRFAAAFSGGNVAAVRDLYHPEVVYVSPTTRLFGRPSRVEGIDAALEFIQQTIEGCTAIDYRVDDRALVSGTPGAFVRITFDFDIGEDRVRSTYVVLYHYRDGLIAAQELYYDPSGPFEKIGPAGGG